MGKDKSSKSKKFKLLRRDYEDKEIKLLEAWVDFGKPDTGFNTLALDPPSKDSRIGRLPDGNFSRFAGADKFLQLPISKKTKKGLEEAGFENMTDIQRASLPHSLCGRDILGAAKTGSGKTLAFVIPVLEKLYRAKWGPEDGVGCIIMCHARELAEQLFEVLNSVGKKHGFSAGLLIGGRKDIDTEKECVNRLNILVCTPGRLLQHMDETPDFDCSSLQILVIDEADCILLDKGFKKDVNAIISQLPKGSRQTLLFSATQTKSVKDLARLSLKDPEYINVHEEAVTATPIRLQQIVMIVPLDQKLDMLWTFLKSHIHSRILVFFSTRKQVKFAYEAFKKLRPGVPLKCLHRKMKQDRRAGIYEQFCQEQSVLFATDLASRGLDFNEGPVDWVVQVDCPDNVDTYIHRVGRTARYRSSGRAVLFLDPTETKMIDKLRENKIPVETKASMKKLQPVSGLLAALLVKYPNLQQLAQRSFITYLRSIHKQKHKEVFDLNKLPIDEFSASLGLPMTPRIRFLRQKDKGQKESQTLTIVPERTSDENENTSEHSKQNLEDGRIEEAESQEDVFLNEKNDLQLGEENITDLSGVVPGTRVLKKKKLKINVNRPVGTRVVFDEDGETLPPLARYAVKKADIDLDKDKVNQRWDQMREKMKVADKEDKALDRQRRKEMRVKKKNKLKRGRDEEDSDASENGISGLDREGRVDNKKSKIYFDSDDEDGMRMRNTDSIGVGPKPPTVAEQEELALKLLNSMNS